MSTRALSWGDATEILEAKGVVAVHEFSDAYASDNEKAALTVPMCIFSAVGAKDGDAFADVFAPNGSLVQYDDELPTREDIRSYIKAAFAGPFKDCEITGRLLSLKFLTEDIAMLIEEAGVLLPGESTVAPERRFYVTWVIARRDEGHLELMSFQQSPIGG